MCVCIANVPCYTVNILDQEHVLNLWWRVCSFALTKRKICATTARHTYTLALPNWQPNQFVAIYFSYISSYSAHIHTFLFSSLFCPSGLVCLLAIFFFFFLFFLIHANVNSISINTSRMIRCVFAYEIEMCLTRVMNLYQLTVALPLPLRNSITNRNSRTNITNEMRLLLSFIINLFIFGSIFQIFLNSQNLIIEWQCVFSAAVVSIKLVNIIFEWCATPTHPTLMMHNIKSYRKQNLFVSIEIERIVLKLRHKICVCVRPNLLILNDF